MPRRRNSPRGAAGKRSPRRVSPQPGDSGTITVASWNIRDGRNGGLEGAAKGMNAANVDIAVLQETKLTGEAYTRNSSGYFITATDAASSPGQGGIALCWREDNERFEVEEVRKRGVNVISCQLVTGRERLFIVGCYIPPDDLTALESVRAEWQRCPGNCKPLLLGDLNINLDQPFGDAREQRVAEEMDAMGLEDLSRHFAPRQRRYARGRWTWRQRREGRWVSSQPDYILGRGTTRRRFRRIGFRRPCHHNSDH